MERMSEKSRLYAYFFSIILPGLGQIYLKHKNRGFMILTGAVILSITLSFLFAFPLNWIIMAAYWIWQVFDAFFLYKSQNEVNKKTRLVKHEIPNSTILESLLINNVK
jgi:TM2 domain-containing membrane protein YozV